VVPGKSTASLLPHIRLPAPKLGPAKSLAQSLRLRRTTREISDRRLPLQLFSNLLWAACGVNRRRGPFGTPGLTSATASNSQEIDVYVAKEDGIFRFDPRRHRLALVAAGDYRALTISPGQRETVRMTAPVHLIFVVDIHRLTHTTGFEEPGLHQPEVQKSYYYVDTGLMAGNVYLYAASQGLGCWFHNCDRGALKRVLKLGSEQRVLFAQSVGYPRRRGL